MVLRTNSYYKKLLLYRHGEHSEAIQKKVCAVLLLCEWWKVTSHPELGSGSQDFMRSRVKPGMTKIYNQSLGFYIKTISPSNKGLNVLVMIFYCLLVWFLIAPNVFATAATNVNEISDFFSKEVEEKKELERFLEDSRGAAASGISNKEGLKNLPVSESEAQRVASDLSSIEANSLESAGREVQAKEENQYLETLEVDYSSPLVISHKRDTDLIASSSERLMSRLLDGLKDLGVDCKTVKGNKETEPAYYLDIQKEHSKDVTYNQSMCEELRNQYHCTRTLSVKCAHLVPATTIPQTIRIALDEVRGWWTGVVFGYGIPGVMEALKQLIIAKTGQRDIEVPLQQIMILMGQLVFYQIDPYGNYGQVQGTWHDPPESYNGSVRFFYRVPQGAVCLRWNEEFNEACRLK